MNAIQEAVAGGLHGGIVPQYHAWGRCGLPCGEHDSIDHAHPMDEARNANHHCVLPPGHEGRCEFLATCKLERKR